uniref:Mucin-2-like n=1 Tax=Gouania willdenowi TaxID=441366 RepID=A0A8C5DCD2_GOUWI
MSICIFLSFYTCRTFGSGVIQPFNGSSYYIRSNCPFTLTHFTHHRVECDITVQRGENGLLEKVQIIVNKIKTVLQSGDITVEKVSPPYDHTYQHIFPFGIFTRLRSALLPLSVTWHSVAGGIDTLWVELEQDLSTDMTGLCGIHNNTGSKDELITNSALAEDFCQIKDPLSAVNIQCRTFFSHTLDCLHAETISYLQLCEWNINSYESSDHIACAFFKEITQQCGNSSFIWNKWRMLTDCAEPTCPGDLIYAEKSDPFVPSCSHQNRRVNTEDLTDSCVCTEGLVLNDHEDGFHCVNVSSCPCVFSGRTYKTGDMRNTKCQSCLCEGGKWHCTRNLCLSKCIIEGPFVTSFDGKEYEVPGRCTYVASQGPNWMLKIEFHEKETSVKKVTLKILQVCIKQYHTLVFWQSSMYVQVNTNFGLKIQVQVSPEIQLYITPPRENTDNISGLCGNSNTDTTDDFTTSSGMVENSAQAFALSWSVGSCPVNIPVSCINADNEIFADQKCSVLINPSGIFAECHEHIPVDPYLTTCILRTCNCDSNLQHCLCASLSSYAKACVSLGVAVGDWRKTYNCTVKCQKNLDFSYKMLGCNHTCRSLSGSDPRCGLGDYAVEGCGCTEGTHLSEGNICTPKVECTCHHRGGTTPPGPVSLFLFFFLGCTKGKVCIHCSENPVDTTQKTCDSLSKPMGHVAVLTCESGCYCPYGQFEDHNGHCTNRYNCTCMYSGKVFSPGQQVKTNCKTCVCGGGQWHCRNDPCPGRCQVYGKGHYQTFDSKWYRFDGHCQYTLVEDYCGSRNGTFSIRVESVPCCDEALTCSRSIVDKVTLTLSDMRVTKKIHKAWTLQHYSLYTIRTVGLYTIVSVPDSGITLIWDKHTSITIKIDESWRVICGLCGNFDASEKNDLQIDGSSVFSSAVAFGNSWKMASPPCSDVTSEVFPCQRNSYCSAWAQRRCRILTGDTFKECHFKVDPEPYYRACVQESCSCEFEGKFLGFCTSVAAYAEACSDQDVCIDWRTPDLCPVYCDFYNERGQCRWHYEACGQMMACGKENNFTHKLEGCYPRCPEENPYYDENTGECATLRNCTCFFNDTIVQPGKVLVIASIECSTESPTKHTNGLITSSSTAPSTKTTTNHLTTQQTTNQTTATSPSTTISVTNTEFSTELLTSSFTTHAITPTSGQATTKYEECRCKDLKKKKSWACGETWTEDCFVKNCNNRKIELTPVECPDSLIPTCPRGQAIKVSDGCCDSWKCDCQCVLYGDPHYISFKGVTFDFLDDCSYILVEERSPVHQLTIVVDNFYCVPGLKGSCAKGIILNYQNNEATLSVIPALFVVQATLNNMTIQAPYEEHGFRFETTDYMVTIHMPQIRSYISLTPFYTLTINLAMENFENNTHGQCGVCGGASCIRKGGQIEDDECCDKTAYDWVYPDPRKPACVSAPRNVPCNVGPTAAPTQTPSYTTSCPPSPLCDVLHHQAFANCSKHVNLNLMKKNCEFDSCRVTNTSCSSLEQAAEECKEAGFCIDWRKLINGSCDVSCPKGLVYRECSDKLDDFCFGGIQYSGAFLEKKSEGCFCPHGLSRAGNHSNICVPECPYCKGPSGEPKLPGQVWQSNCKVCTCNNQTRTEECVSNPVKPTPVCGPNTYLVESSCCGEQICDKWRNASHPCLSFSCSEDGIQTETRVCPKEHCPEIVGKNNNHKICTDDYMNDIMCSMSPYIYSIRLVLQGDLQVEQEDNCCEEKSSERRSLTLHCSDLTTRHYNYQHITSCECRACKI